MAGRSPAAKQAKLGRAKDRLSRAAQARIRLKLVDDRHEIIKPDNPFELEARPGIAGPDHIGFDPADHRQTDDDAVAALKLPSIIDHKAVGRQVADMQVQIAMHEVLDNSRKIDRMARCAP
jgi:hypothetical protein